MPECGGTTCGAICRGSPAVVLARVVAQAALLQSQDDCRSTGNATNAMCAAKVVKAARAMNAAKPMKAASAPKSARQRNAACKSGNATHEAVSRLLCSYSHVCLVLEQLKAEADECNERKRCNANETLHWGSWEHHYVGPAHALPEPRPPAHRQSRALYGCCAQSARSRKGEPVPSVGPARADASWV